MEKGARMKYAVILMAMLCTGCAQFGSIVDAKRATNDFQAETWVLAGCDLSLAGYIRQVPEKLQEALMSHCQEVNE